MNIKEVVLHPLAILQITQSVTYRIQNAPENLKKMVGVLAGTIEDEVISVAQSSDIPLEMFLKDMKQEVGFITEVFQEYTHVGWYFVSSNEPTQEDIEIHKKVAGEKENCVCLRVDVSKLSNIEDKDLPISFYILKEEKFVPLRYTIASVEIEKIGVSDLKNKEVVGDQQKVEREKENIKSSINTMKKKTQILVNYLKAVQEGKIPKDDEIILNISRICSSLPVSDNRLFKEEFEQESNDAKLVSLMMELMKALVVINEQTYSYVELQKHYQDKVRREEDRQRQDTHMGMHDYRMGGFGMPYSGMGRYMEDDDSE